MAPAVLLIRNRVFKPQFLIMLFVGWVIAGPLLAVARADQLLLTGLVCCATLASTLVYPTLAGFWGYCSGILVMCAVAASYRLRAAYIFESLRGRGEADVLAGD